MNIKYEEQSELKRPPRSLPCPSTSETMPGVLSSVWKSPQKDTQLGSTLTTLVTWATGGSPSSDTASGLLSIERLFTPVLFNPHSL